MSLRARMGIAAGVAVALAVIAVAVSAYAGTRSQLTGSVDSQLRSLARSAIHAPSGGPAPPGEGRDADEGLGFDERRGPAFGGAAGSLTLFRADGGVYAPQQDRIPATGRIKALARSGRGQFFTDLEADGTHIRVLAMGVGWRGAVAVALPLTEVDKTLRSELVLLVLIAAGGIALAALLGVLVARTAAAPIVSFTRQTERIAANPERLEHERIDVTGNDEIARLAQTFNRTLDALERSLHAQRNLVADASHELRTPIATIRANLQLMRDEALLSPEDREALRADIIDELDELTALVGDVVELARGSKTTAEPGDVRVDSVVADVVEKTRRRAPGLTLQTDLDPTLVRGDGERIARAVTNLLDNARKWSPEGGTVEVTLRDGTLTVRDHGPGFKDEDLPFVFDRFYRARDARGKPGSGLGLAIVRQAAEAHGGSVEAANTYDGGAVIRISFGQPLALEESGMTRDLHPNVAP